MTKAIKDADSSIYNPIDIEKYKQDIEKRQNMRQILQKEAKLMAEELDLNQRQAKKSFHKLKSYHEGYKEVVFKSVVRIQLWFKAWKSRQFFKTLLRKEIMREKKKLQVGLNDMVETV